MILHKIRRSPRLAGIEMIAVDGNDQDRCDWRVAVYPSVAARAGDLQRIIAAMKKKYALKTGEA